MKRMRKNNTIILFVVLLLSISIGYALINTNLKINGTANVTKQTWDIHFENIQVTEGSVSTQNPATINPEYPTTVTYNIHLENPGDFYEFEVDAVNNGSIDAMITNITNTDNGQSISLPSYMEYKVTYSSGTDLDINHILEANTTETYKVGIYFKQDIQASDLANSDPLDLRLKFEVTYGQATDEAIPTGDITVTFNPNGGTLSKTTKKVATNGKYGNLPTPTRPGYIFKGWHGVNEFDIKKVQTSNASGRKSTVVDDKIMFDSSIVSGNTADAILIQKWKNNAYVSALNVRNFQLGPYSFSFTNNDTIDEIFIKMNTSKGDAFAYYILPELINNSKYTLSYNIDSYDIVGAKATISKIQLQIGTNATAWEPYYITKNTTVAQTTDHTLTAIWEPITSTVTLDYNDGVTANTTMRVTYGSTYENLPTPTRTGYTFKGWNGKNLLNYNIMSWPAVTLGICVDSNGNISDSSPTSSDGRAWTFASNNHWKESLAAGDYTLSLFFSQVATPGSTNDTRIQVIDSDEKKLCNVNFANQTFSSCSFTLSQAKEVVIVAKSYDGVYKIQLENGMSSTPWEPYYITSNTVVEKTTDHTLTAIWEENT